ncbi:MAG TPA: tryptophan synthase subunit alpha [Nitrospirales bacterium]|nr:tryptophan synthase subunit alpha [Nitrospirales bacterium]HIC05005.1 tryptophan synthase subunit alpha [Nitrospirales bacterium]HIN33663.1 tryptophan synthase subunit alpha [Nitrospirales bacterium]
MGRIHLTFSQLRAKNQKALIPYIMAGDPSLEMTEALVLEIERAGADIVELGVPFSDPIADGPVIQGAAQRSLQAGTSLQQIFRLVQSLRTRTQIPLVLMCYYNSILAYGEKRFCHAAVEAGVDGVIVPDLPVEEGAGFRKMARISALDVILLLAPTSTAERVGKAVKASQGFVYYVSLTGVTGAQLVQVAAIEKKVREIRQASQLPVAVGFGISSPSEAAAVASIADGVIVGSALVKIIAKPAERSAVLNRVSAFVRDHKQAVS